MKPPVTLLVSGCLYFGVGCGKGPPDGPGEPVRDDRRTEASAVDHPIATELRATDGAPIAPDGEEDPAPEPEEVPPTTRAQAAEEKAHAEGKLNERLRDLELRAGKLRGRTPVDPGERERFEELAGAAERTLGAARASLQEFASYKRIDWRPQHEAAKSALDRVDHDLGLAESFRRAAEIDPPVR
jgi:hypothetical protein